jgi:hypothetical protein
MIRVPLAPLTLGFLGSSGLAVLALLAVSGRGTATGEPIGAPLEPALEGAIDIHAHPDPDSRERSIDSIDYARLARDHGMRGFVIKQHDDHTAGLAYLVRKAVPGIEVYGVLVLNRSMGGINVEAVDRFASVTGGWGRIVSMPTADAARVPVSRDGRRLPEVVDVLSRIATTRTRDSEGALVLATGHASAEESLMLVREGRRLGIEHIVITHPLGRLSLEQMEEAARLGAFLEITADRVLIDESGAQLDRAAEVIRRVGPRAVILSSDLGRPDLPLLHPNALAGFASALRQHGFTDAELGTMLRDNPARLLGLPAAPAR